MLEPLSGSVLPDTLTPTWTLNVCQCGCGVKYFLFNMIPETTEFKGGKKERKIPKQFVQQIHLHLCLFFSKTSFRVQSPLITFESELIWPTWLIKKTFKEESLVHVNSRYTYGSHTVTVHYFDDCRPCRALPVKLLREGIYPLNPSLCSHFLGRKGGHWRLFTLFSLLLPLKRLPAEVTTCFAAESGLVTRRDALLSPSCTRHQERAEQHRFWFL